MDVICNCGAQPTYPHHPCCPYPCYRDNAEWERKFEANIKAMNAAEDAANKRLQDEYGKLQPA